MKEWFNNLKPGQQFLLRASLWFVGGVVFAVAHQSIGARRGYRKGYATGHADGMSPIKRTELELAEKRGYREGWYDGAWADQPEVFSAGLKAGAELVQESNRQAFDAINQARIGSGASTNQIPA